VNYQVAFNWDSRPPQRLAETEQVSASRKSFSLFLLLDMVVIFFHYPFAFDGGSQRHALNKNIPWV